jgi:hypothetical protein
MTNVKILFLGVISLTTAGNLYLILQSARQAFRQHSSFDLLFLGEMGFLLVVGLAFLFSELRKTQRSGETKGSFVTGFSFCLFLNLGVQSGLMLARHLANPPILMDTLHRILHRG